MCSDGYKVFFQNQNQKHWFWFQTGVYCSDVDSGDLQLHLQVKDVIMLHLGNFDSLVSQRSLA